MEKLDPTAFEQQNSYETWVDGVDPATVEAIKAGAKFRVLDDEWVWFDDAQPHRIIRAVELA